jgi:hypothetical protein
MTQATNNTALANGESHSIEKAEVVQGTPVLEDGEGGLLYKNLPILTLEQALHLDHRQAKRELTEICGEAAFHLDKADAIITRHRFRFVALRQQLKARGEWTIWQHEHICYSESHFRALLDPSYDEKKARQNERKKKNYHTGKAARKANETRTAQAASAASAGETTVTNADPLPALVAAYLATLSEDGEPSDYLLGQFFFKLDPAWRKASYAAIARVNAQIAKANKAEALAAEGNGKKKPTNADRKRTFQQAQKEQKKRKRTLRKMQAAQAAVTEEEEAAEPQPAQASAVEEPVKQVEEARSQPSVQVTEAQREAMRRMGGGDLLDPVTGVTLEHVAGLQRQAVG